MVLFQPSEMARMPGVFFTVKDVCRVHKKRVDWLAIAHYERAQDLTHASQWHETRPRREQYAIALQHCFGERVTEKDCRQQRILTLPLPIRKSMLLVSQ